MTDRAAIASLVKKSLIREAKLTMTPLELSDGLSFNTDIHINSLGFIRAVIAIEDELAIETSDEALMQTRFSTIGELVDFFAAAVHAQQRGQP